MNKRVIALPSLFLALLIAHLVLPAVSRAEAVDLSGIQPLAPDGVFSTFGAGSLNEGKAAAAFSFEKASEPDLYRYSAHLAYGVTDNFEVMLSVPYISEWQREDSGFEDTAIGFKHRFFKEGRYGPSVAYLLTAAFLTGRDQFSTDGYAGAGIIVSKRVGPVSGHFNFIYSKPGDSDLDSQMVIATGFDFAAAHNFKMLVELFARKSYYSAEVDQLEARFGYRILTRDNIFTTIGAGFDLKDNTPQYRVMLSLTVLYPEERRAVRKVFEEGE